MTTSTAPATSTMYVANTAWMLFRAAHPIRCCYPVKIMKIIIICNAHDWTWTLWFAKRELSTAYDVVSAPSVECDGTRAICLNDICNFQHRWSNIIGSLVLLHLFENRFNSSVNFAEWQKTYIDILSFRFVSCSESKICMIVSNVICLMLQTPNSLREKLFFFFFSESGSSDDGSHRQPANFLSVEMHYSCSFRRYSVWIASNEEKQRKNDCENGK